MDGDRFDAMLRSLTGGPSRRGVLRGVAAGMAGALVGLLTREAPAGAKRRRHKRRKGVYKEDSAQRKCKQASRPCSFDTHCCSEVCCNKRCCAAGERCNDNGECEEIPPPPPPPPPPVTCNVAQNCNTCGTPENGCTCVPSNANPDMPFECVVISACNTGCATDSDCPVAQACVSLGACDARFGDICCPRCSG